MEIRHPGIATMVFARAFLVEILRRNCASESRIRRDFESGSATRNSRSVDKKMHDISRKADR
ncbi:hypothetical protein E4U53_003770 [Claviceps sorghi]|nr:hypothetical protein E4U53_003770 [Claviceps sorghi]